MPNDLVITINESNFDTLVMQASLPVLIDFWAPWCGPCRMLAPIINQIALQVHGKAVIGKVNVDENPKIAGRFLVQAIPQISIFHNGEVKDKLVGYTNKASLLSKLEAIISASADTNRA